MLEMSNTFFKWVYSVALLKLAEMEYCGTTRYSYYLPDIEVMVCLRDVHKCICIKLFRMDFLDVPVVKWFMSWLMVRLSGN